MNNSIIQHNFNIDPQEADDLTDVIDYAVSLEEKHIFKEGLAERLRELRIECGADDTEIMLEEIKKRYKEKLGKSCPKAVSNWIKGVTPGLTNKVNNYELCFALDMDLKQTSDFFQKIFLTQPFNCKSRTDAVFLYCLHHRRNYDTIRKMLEDSAEFVTQENVHTSTSQIAHMIYQTDDDEKFMQYLSKHCYSNKQQFQVARSMIKNGIEFVKENIRNDVTIKTVSYERLNSQTISGLLGYRYQSGDSRKNRVSQIKLPKHFTESLPNDVTIGHVLNDSTASYETLRKMLMIIKFYCFYTPAKNCDEDSVISNLLDFHAELNTALSSCGFAEIFTEHPFDWLLLYCAGTYDPIISFHLINEF